MQYGKTEHFLWNLSSTPEPRNILHNITIACHTAIIEGWLLWSRIEFISHRSRPMVLCWQEVCTPSESITRLIHHN